ncbi:MAG: polysaccharide deacetylase family protein [Deltaproteobacteria bacterium]|nr:polysaccharide deacetylase family protein [Deltaproteobacteria bacterium]
MWVLLLLVQMSLFVPPGPAHPGVSGVDAAGTAAVAGGPAAVGGSGATAVVGHSARGGAEGDPSIGEPARCDRVVLSRLYAGFEQADPTLQGELAALAGAQDWRGGLRELREAAARFDSGALPSLLALAVLKDLDSVELFREVVRQGSDDAAVALAAYVLGQWRDNFSYSTLLVGLMRPRCRGACVAGLLAGVVSLTHHPYLRPLLQLVHRASPSGEARVAAAAWLASAAGRTTANEVRATLSEVLVGEDLARDAELLPVRVLAMWGLARLSETDCETALAAGLAGMQKSTDETGRQRLARAILVAGLPCLKKGDGADDRMQGLLDSAGWTSSMVADRTRFASWLPPVFLEGGERTRFGLVERAEDASAQLPLACRRRLSSAESYGPAAVSRGWVRRPELKELARQAAGWIPMQGFDRYEFTPRQPTWWPSWIDITIDDGPQPTMFRLRGILDALDRWGVRATFFFIGGNMARLAVAHPEEGTELMRRVLLSGHRLGYHSIGHDTKYDWHLQFFTPEQIRDDVDLYEEVVTATIGLQWERRWARLPGGMGRSHANVRQGLELAGLHDHVHWNVDQEHWGTGTSAGHLRELARRLVKSRRPTVVLLHETAPLGRQLDAFIEGVFEATCDGEVRFSPGRTPECLQPSVPARAPAP